ncbi:unnamed protein product [Boreogadus saida]
MKQLFMCYSLKQSSQWLHVKILPMCVSTVTLSCQLSSPLHPPLSILFSLHPLLSPSSSLSILFSLHPLLSPSSSPPLSLLLLLLSLSSFFSSSLFSSSLFSSSSLLSLL